MTRTLADHGATVVKVESVRRLDAARTFLPFWHNEAGVENSALFDNLNAGKHSISLNIADRGRAARCSTTCSAGPTSWSTPSHPGAGTRSASTTRRCGRSTRRSSTCRSACSASTGRWSSWPGTATSAAALAGCYEITGWPDRAPAGPYLAYTDYTSAHLMLVTVMAGVLHRARGGPGRFVEVSQAETALQFLAPGPGGDGRRPGGAPFTRMGNDDLAMAPHGVYPCAGEDRWVAVACQDDDRWLALCELLGRGDLADDPALRTAAGRLRPAGPPRRGGRRLDGGAGARRRGGALPGGGHRRLHGPEQRRVPGRSPARAPGPLRAASTTPSGAASWKPPAAACPARRGAPSATPRASASTPSRSSATSSATTPTASPTWPPPRSSSEARTMRTDCPACDRQEAGRRWVGAAPADQPNGGTR